MHGADVDVRGWDVLQRGGDCNSRQDLRSLRGRNVFCGSDFFDVCHRTKDCMPNDAINNLPRRDLLLGRRERRHRPGVHAVRRGHLRRRDVGVDLRHHRLYRLPVHRLADVRRRHVPLCRGHGLGRQDLHGLRPWHLPSRYDALNRRHCRNDRLPIADYYVRRRHILLGRRHHDGRQDLHDVRCWHLLGSNDDSLYVRHRFKDSMPNDAVNNLPRRLFLLRRRYNDR